VSHDPNEYNFPYRKNYELRIMLVWFMAAICCFFAPYFIDVPKQTYLIVAASCIVVGLILGRNGIVIHIKIKRLKGYPLEFIDPNSDAALKLFGIKDKEVINSVKRNRK